MEKNWVRRYTMEVGQQGKTGFKIGDIRDKKQSALHISFSVEKSDAESANTAKVKVWNLSPANLKMLDEKDNILILKAGYGNNMPLILTGAVTKVETELENADRITDIEVVDGRIELRDTNMSISLNESVNSQDVYNSIADAMGISITFAKDLEFKTFPNGFSFVGKARNAMQRVTDANGHAWSIQNGVIHVTYPGRPIISQGYLLTSKTGLLGVPKRITVSQNQDNDDSLVGYEIKYFLNGAIGINDTVQIESSTANGYYIIRKLTMDGDNYDSDWICTAEVLEIKALPKTDKKKNAVIKEISAGHSDITNKKFSGFNPIG